MEEEINQDTILSDDLYFLDFLVSLAVKLLFAIHFKILSIFNLNISKRKEKIYTDFFTFWDCSLVGNCRVVSRIHLESWTRHQCCAEVYNSRSNEHNWDVELVLLMSTGR